MHDLLRLLQLGDAWTPTAGDPRWHPTGSFRKVLLSSFTKQGGRPEAVAEVVNCWPGEGAPQTRLIGTDIRRYVTQISSGELLGPRKVGGKSKGVHRAVFGAVPVAFLIKHHLSELRKAFLAIGNPLESVR